MSKNTQSSAFRKTNVDLYDEDNYEDDDVQTTETGAAEFKSREAECKKHLAAGNKVEALKAALSAPPQLSKDKNLKEQSARNVMKVILEFKVDEIAPAVVALDQDQVDVLMKYAYRGMGDVPGPQATEDQREEFAKLCSLLLAFHGAATNACGLGSIVRALSERKTV